ncbi:hypothetical protein K8I28_01655 [bacterium]|nr:hypothetical protein [bacterium]
MFRKMFATISVTKVVMLLAIGSLMIFGIGCSEDDDPVSSNGGSGDVEILTGTIVENTTLTNDKEYLLRGGVFVGTNDGQVTLTIEAGTTIYGESSTTGMLVIKRGAKIMAEGTADAPIVFTSDKAVGQRNRGDWGGLIINGRASLNTGDEATGEGGTGNYGGTDDEDNSGVLKYVRVEFAGQELSPDNELNGIAFQGVGRGTTVDYIQVHMNKDDGVEFFGGTVNAKHVVITGAADDQFDWTDGWRGKGQFWVCQQYGDDADQGIEADNNADENDASPRSNPTLYNLTLIGDRQNAESDIGMLLREGTAAKIYNAIVMNFGDCGIDLDHEATFTNGHNGTDFNGNLVVANSIFFDNAEAAQSGEDDEPNFLFTTDEFINNANFSNRFSNPSLVDALNKDNPNFAPAGGSPALTGAANVPPGDSFFDAVNYVGAFAQGDNWMDGWTYFAQQ